MVCHIFCSSLSHVGIAVFAFHSTSSISCLTPLLPTARKSWHSFAHCVLFRSFHFQGICLFPPCKSMWLQPCSVSLHTAFHRTHTPLQFIRSNTLHSLTTSSPCLFQRTVRAKKCAKPAAGSTRPPRSALPVSGALAPLAAARTQRTG